MSTAKMVIQGTGCKCEMGSTTPADEETAAPTEYDQLLTELSAERVAVLRGQVNFSEQRTLDCDVLNEHSSTIGSSVSRTTDSRIAMAGRGGAQWARGDYFPLSESSDDDGLQQRAQFPANDDMARRDGVPRAQGGYIQLSDSGESSVDSPYEEVMREKFPGIYSKQQDDALVPELQVAATSPVRHEQRSRGRLAVRDSAVQTEPGPEDTGPDMRNEQCRAWHHCCQESRQRASLTRTTGVSGGRPGRDAARRFPDEGTGRACTPVDVAPVDAAPGPSAHRGSSGQ